MTSDKYANVVTYKITMRYPIESPRSTEETKPEIFGNGLAKETGNFVTFNKGEKGFEGSWILKLKCLKANEYTATVKLSANAQAK